MPAFSNNKWMISENEGLDKRRSKDSLDPINVYFKDISKMKMLTKQEEHLLAIKAKEGDQDARACMIKGNLRLVVSIAKKYVNKGLPFLDLIEEGNLGLIKAVSKFDPYKGYKFSTYATWWIKQNILRALAKYSNTIKLPINMSETMNRFLRVLRNMTQRLGRNPTEEELADELKISPEKILNMLNAIQQRISIDIYLDKNVLTGAEETVDEIDQAPVKSIMRKNRQKYIDTLLNVLNDQEKSIIKMRFGLFDGETKTLESIGKMYNITRERVRQIESSALKKLKKILRGQKINMTELL